MIRRKLYYQMKYYVFFLHCSFLISLSGIAQVDKMNKSELREFAKTCISEKTQLTSEKTQLTKELEQQIKYGKNTLSQIHIQAEKIQQLKNKLSSQKESHKISKELLNAKNAYIGKLQSELQTLESQSIKSEFQTLSSKEDFLHQMTGYLKPKLNDLFKIESKEVEILGSKSVYVINDFVMIIPFDLTYFNAPFLKLFFILTSRHK